MDTEDKTRIFKTFKSKNGQEVILRELRITDVKDMTELYNSHVEENLELDIPYTLWGEKRTLEKTEEWLIDKLKNMTENKQINMVAEVNGKVIAICGVFRDRELHEHRAELGIVVHKDYREIGIGKQMIEISTEEAKKLGVQVITLGFYETNERAKTLYEKLGFKEYGRLPKGVNTKKGYIADVFMYKDL